MFTKHNMLIATITEISEFAGIKPPTLRIVSGRNACYRPLSHRIFLSRKLFEELSPSALRAILAHEVGHARQRGAILKFAFPMFGGLFIAVALLIMALVTDFMTNVSPWWLLGFVAPAFGACIAVSILATRMLESGYCAREVDADRFSNAFLKDKDAMRQALQECADIEDGGVLGEEVLSRIKAMAIP